MGRRLRASTTATSCSEPAGSSSLRVRRRALRSRTDADSARAGDDAGYGGHDPVRHSSDARACGTPATRSCARTSCGGGSTPPTLPFQTTADVAPLVGTIGQPRALEAIEFGLGVETHGFNIFVAGSPGTGRRTTALDYIQSRAAALPVPDDWVYVHNFAAVDRPNAIRLPAGSGARFAADMDELVATARREIPRAFESDDYDRRRREAVAEASARQEALEAELTAFAAERGFALKTGLTGIATIPLVDGSPITREQFAHLDEAAARADHEGRRRDRGADRGLRAQPAPGGEGRSAEGAGAREGGRAVRDRPTPAGARGAVRRRFPRCSRTWTP